MPTPPAHKKQGIKPSSAQLKQLSEEFLCLYVREQLIALAKTPEFKKNSSVNAQMSDGQVLIKGLSEVLAKILKLGLPPADLEKEYSNKAILAILPEDVKTHLVKHLAINTKNKQYKSQETLKAEVFQILRQEFSNGNFNISLTPFVKSKIEILNSRLKRIEKENIGGKLNASLKNANDKITRVNKSIEVLSKTLPKRLEKTNNSLILLNEKIERFNKKIKKDSIKLKM